MKTKIFVIEQDGLPARMVKAKTKGGAIRFVVNTQITARVPEHEEYGDMLMNRGIAVEDATTEVK